MLLADIPQSKVILPDSERIRDTIIIDGSLIIHSVPLYLAQKHLVTLLTVSEKISRQK